MGPLRVLHVYKDYPPVLGGIEKHIHTLAHLQVHMGLEVTVLVTNPQPFPRSTRTSVDPGPPRVIRAGRWSTIASTPLSLAQAAWQRRLTADIVHLHFPYPPGEVANYLWGRGRRTVLTYHSDVVRQRILLRLYRPLLWRILRSVDAILATSPAYVQTSPFLRKLTERVHVIPLGIDPTPFSHPDPNTVSDIRRRWARNGAGPVLLFVGRLRYYKGLDVLLDALVHIPDALLWVIGRGPMEDAWQHRAKVLGLTGRVRFIGDVEEEQLPLYYAAADLFVLPATQRAEAFGLVLVEAMMAGLPVISTELGTGTSFINIHGETGLVVPPNDVGALVRAIRTLLDAPDLRTRMGHTARARALAEFTADTMARRVLDVYRQTLENPPNK